MNVLSRAKKTGRQNHIGCFFKFHLEVGVEETIVNVPLVYTLVSKMDYSLEFELLGK
jgi:hypothetical protein